MPVFHTKTIESILEPVAQQVSRLVILHEEAEDGNAMPDLSRPVQVQNLIKVGRETINSSEDPILRQDMPAALQRVEKASKLLEEASNLLKSDPYSQPARKKLIEGARGILQGTSALLLCFDESEVRKIIRECKKVLDYLAVAEVVESMEDLVQFVKDLSPCLTKVSRDVDAREKELTHQVHREILVRCLESVKALAPVLICSMKIFVQLIGHGGKEAAENRNYLAQRMTDEIHEIIRVLQLTTYDEDEWDADNLTVMKRAQNAIRSKQQAAHDWLEDPTAVVGGIGEKSIRQILDYANRVAERAMPRDRDLIRKLSSEVTALTNALCELRQEGKGGTSQEWSLSRGIDSKLRDLLKVIDDAITNIERSGIQQLAHTLGGRLEQAQHWLANPNMDDKGLGQQAIQQIVEESRRLAEGSPPQQKSEIQILCNEIEGHSRQLVDLSRRGLGSSPQAVDIARKISGKLYQLKTKIQRALVNRVVEDFIDITSPLKQFTDAVYAAEGVPNRESNFQEKAQTLMRFSQRVASTARNVAKGGTSNKKLAEALLASANQVESLTPQLRNAGRIRLDYPENKAADEHFENLMKQYTESLQKMRFLVDEAIDTPNFIKSSEDNIVKHTSHCENAITLKNPQNMVDNTSTIARLANRVLMVAKQESENSEDPHFIDRVNMASDQLQSSVKPMLQDAKGVTMNISDQVAISRWRESNKALISAVGQVRYAVTVAPEEPPEIPPPPDMSNLQLNAKPRPPVQEIPDFSEIFNVDFNSIFEQLERPRPHRVSEKPETGANDTSQNGKTNQSPDIELPSVQYHFFTDKVGPTVRQQPYPNSRSPVPPQLLSTTSPRTPDRSVSPLPEWARGETADLLIQEVGAQNGQYESREEYPSVKSYHVATNQDVPPPRPPLPGMEVPPPRPPPPVETDDEFEASFPAPQPNQPIMMAAHGLHQEVRQWSSKDNEIIAAAKKMALLMARLSQLVRGEGGSKRDLIACAKAIAEASEEVTRLAKELARMCTDKRMRTNILQVCERIPTIGTQLRILSTVKATMLGAQGTEEDQEATDMLVGNAQNLMQSVKETVRACEAASIKIRTDSGIHLRWIRKQPWYQY